MMDDKQDHVWHVNKTRSYRCRFCQKTYTTKEGIIMHLINDHNEEPYQVSYDVLITKEYTKLKTR
ncbi:MAG: hypothetical protein QW292_09075 [Candidatus Parvarchaeota archaeon]